MQQLLVSVLNTEFGLNVDIINGATSRRGDTRSGNHTRKAIVNRFRESRGFNVLVRKLHSQSASGGQGTGYPARGKY
jgi:hypothetical protein